MKDDIEKSFVRCSCKSCDHNFCPVENYTCSLKFVNIDHQGKCMDFRGKDVLK